MASRSALCPSLEVLSAYAGCTLTSKGMETIRQHLEECPSCRSRLTQVAQSTMPVTHLSAMAKEGAAESEAGAIPAQLAKHPTYQIKRELGRGGMGVVYLGFDRLMERPVVIKVVNKELLKKPGATERFLREIRSAARLQHPNVMATYAAIQEGDLLAFAMEYVPGVDLADTVKSLTAKGQRLPVRNACAYIQQAALGLQHVYDKGMVHRDIKPSNLVLVREGKIHTVKILDFGLAKTRGDKGAEIALIETSNDPAKTGAGRMLGTPDYMAPEQALDAATVDIRADIYSLGCSLYYLLTGRPPFKGKALIDILKSHSQDAATPIHELRTDVPPELSAIAAKAMAKNPDDRYQTPGEMARELLPFVMRTNESAGAKSDVAANVDTMSPSPDETFAVRAESIPAPVTPGQISPLTPGSTITPAPLVHLDWHNKWALAGIAGVVILVGVIVAVVAMSGRTNKIPHGILAISGLPPDAVVKIDDDVRPVTRGDQGIGEVSLPGGDHTVAITSETAIYEGQTKIYIPPGERRAIQGKFKPKMGVAKTDSSATAKQEVPGVVKGNTSGPGTTTAKTPGPGTTAPNKSPPPNGPVDPYVKATLDSTAGLVGGLIGSAAGTGSSPPGTQQQSNPPNVSNNQPSPMPVSPSNATKKGAKKRTVKQPSKGGKTPSKQPQEQAAKKPKEPDPAPPTKAAAKKSSTKSLKDYRPQIMGDPQPQLLRAVYKDLEFEEKPYYVFIPSFEDRENVYFVHPVTRERGGPASFDFSLTKYHAGTLHLFVKNYPFRRDRSKAKGSTIRILTSEKSGRTKLLQTEDIPIQDEWTELEIEFDHQTLRVEQVGLDGDCDGLFVCWEFEEKGAEK